VWGFSICGRHNACDNSGAESSSSGNDTNDNALVII
jgi:hypothetical protein